MASSMQVCCAVADGAVCLPSVRSALSYHTAVPPPPFASLPALHRSPPRQCGCGCDKRWPAHLLRLWCGQGGGLSLLMTAHAQHQHAALLARPEHTDTLAHTHARTHTYTHVRTPYPLLIAPSTPPPPELPAATCTAAGMMGSLGSGVRSGLMELFYGVYERDADR